MHLAANREVSVVNKDEALAQLKPLGIEEAIHPNGIVV